MSRLAELVKLEGPLRRLRQPGPWLWFAIVTGTALRAWFVVGTHGTLDVDIWESHAWEILERGLIPYYHGGRYIFNHPPLMGEIFSRLYVVAAHTGIPFSVFLRAPTAILDFGTALLLLQLLKTHPARYVLFAIYWVSPLTILFSSYHGNTDSALAFFLLGAVLLVSRGRPLLAGALLGVGLWIKFPAILAIPALAIAFPGWRARVEFAGCALVVGVASYVPALLEDAEVVIRSVFLYPGLQIQSTAGVRVWGMQVFYPDPSTLPESWRAPFDALVRWIYRLNTAICVVPIVLVAWARRDRRGDLEIAGNLGASFVIFHGLTNFWAFQYLAWALPLWLVAGWRFAVPTWLVTTTYIYVLYAWLCGSWLLLSPWDFFGHPRWPPAVLLTRNVAITFFFASACFLIAREIPGLFGARPARRGL